MPDEPLIAINARAAVRERPAGVERVAQEMARRLPELRPARYRVVRPPQGFAHKAGQAWEQAVLPLAVRGAALIYSPANLAPLAAGRRNVVVMHDLAAIRHPEWYDRRYRTWHGRVVPALARRARHLIAPSEFSKRELGDLLGVEPDRVSVVPNGVGEEFGPGADPRPATEAHGLRGPYVLAVGTRIARKNLGLLDSVAARLRLEGIEAIVAGSTRDYMRGADGSTVRRLGWVPPDELPGLYAGARALAMPSVYEGFGLPCLEAMASGTPVVAASRGALPEVCGDAALLVDPDDPDAFADALLQAVADGAVRERLVAAGLERAAGFGWRDAALATDAVLGRLLGG